jgi:uncharacterized protein YndB with AHSA1/START domain
MERKTKVTAEEGKQEIVLTREFDLPVDLLFKGLTDPVVLGEWMGTNVLKLEPKKYGIYQFQTSDAQGNVVFTASGVYHEFIPNEKIIRTFEMANANIDVQLEFLDFEAITEDTSRLTMHTLYKTIASRDMVVSFGFAKGSDAAYSKMEQVMLKFK